ncbi:hypothetical protein [Verrucomicrobium spinosum]|uniref:hypothetical protein n=1 Tax=Verrucomicrobium spinosum TaxID=2736 RepID=UPI000A44D17D|nr:hypothetical protein [Verrucomicrobium spinosum]
MLIALGLGVLIGDGFLVVQCEKIEEMDNVGRALLKYAKAWGQACGSTSTARACWRTASRATGTRCAKNWRPPKRMWKRKWCSSVMPTWLI